MNEESQPKNTAAQNAGKPKPDTNSSEAKAKTDWQMPAPVFRVSAGKKIDRAITEEAVAVDLEADTPVDLEAPIESEAPADGPDPGPKPPVSGTVSAKIEEQDVPAPKKKSSLILRIFFSVLGIFGTVLLLIIILILIYFFLLYSGSSSSGFD